LHGLLYGDKSVTSHGYNGSNGFLPSEGRCGYYTSPSNPDRPHVQTGNKIVAFIYDAYDSYEEQHQGVTPSHKELDVSVLARAAACPAYDYKTHIVREYELIFAVVDCETAGPQGDFPAFERCMRMMMNTLSRTHATGYFTMTDRHILYRTVVSEAAFEWQCKFGFTSPSKNGVPMFIDKTVENCVKNMRRWIGHTVRAGHDKRVQRVVFCLKELIDESQTSSIKADSITPRCDFKQPLK